MSRCRLVIVALLAGCAGWDTPSSPSSNTPPPEPGVTPSVARPEAPYTPPREGEVRVKIASVRLSEDCPDAGAASERQAESKREVRESERGDSDRPWCAQSTVQLVVEGDVSGRFRIEAARVLNARGEAPAGTARLRGPTFWTPNSSGYRPWDEQVSAGLTRISYMLGEPTWTSTAAQPFVLEIEVSIDGRRQTVRSPEFSREPPDMVET